MTKVTAYRNGIKISETNINVLIVALSTLFLAILIKKVAKKLPYMLIDCEPNQNKRPILSVNCIE